MDGAPITVAPAGLGMPVTEAPSGFGAPVQYAANGYGLPVVYVPSGGLPVATVGAGQNLFTGPWIQGASTTMTIANGRVRAANAGANPRVYKAISGLSIGVTYRIIGGSLFSVTPGRNMILRASVTDGIPTGDLASGTTDFAINSTFVAGATTIYIGMVVVTFGAGESAEIAENLILLPA